MAISNGKLDEFFKNQKIGATDALKTTDISETKNHTVSKPLANRQHTVSKPLANRQHTVSKPLANRQHTVSKPLANRQHTVSKPLANRQHTVSKPLAEKHNNKNTFLLNDPLEIKLHKFSCKERKFLDLIFWKCYKNGSLESPPIFTEEITKFLDVCSNRVRNIIERILKKGGITVLTFTAGKNAHRVFKFSKKLYQDILDDNVTSNLSIKQEEQFENNQQTVSKPLANEVSISSSNKTTTTNLPDDWEKIDFESLEHIGFSIHQLSQLHEKQLNSPKLIQESINHFSFGLEHNKKTKEYTDPLNVLMGVLRKGRAWFEKNYESPQERALRELEEITRKRQENKEKRIKEIKNIEYKNWINDLNDEEITSIAPKAVKEDRDRLSTSSKAALYTVFDKKIWPEISKKIFDKLELNE